MDKNQLRRLARQARQSQQERDRLSEAICARLHDLEAFRQARRVLWYVGARDEVATRAAITSSLTADQSVAVPYCVGDDLRLFDLQSTDELVRGAFGIEEPAEQLRVDSDRNVTPEQVDFVIVPGLAFDLAGGRLGYGRGYYDRTLERLREGTLRVALAFECQIFDRVPMEPHDIRMDLILTERQAIDCR
ncbi:5-formyltetrahydrofolate cyclo-ligase [Rhodopirellula sp. MGV]|uniref:5-formyltetrahydrofolate cyclo-ligase n=1 Tax=Rhodopirellula sp. MGV TaxID=2023130 RepID=UPI001304611B|nr:5-formyltetrahydrofolate cyclo-ligase [Rhodopirellula sp. MGV]